MCPSNCRKRERFFTVETFVVCRYIFLQSFVSCFNTYSSSVSMCTYLPLMELSQPTEDLCEIENSIPQDFGTSFAEIPIFIYTPHHRLS